MLGASQTTHESWHTQDQAEPKDRSFAITWRRKDCPTEKINFFLVRTASLFIYHSESMVPGVVGVLNWLW